MFLLHVRYPSGLEETLTFETAFLRDLTLRLLLAQPVDLRCEDRLAS